MGVLINQALTTFLVVMQVEAVKKQERGVSYNDAKEDIKYFKSVDKEDEVLRIIAQLKANEKINNIFAVNEYGHVFPKTVAFVEGRFQIVDKQEETK